MRALLPGRHPRRRRGLTVNAGLRWDLYVPWVEEDNKQSNFDVTTGRFVVASDNAVINGVERRALPADLPARPTSVRASVSPTTSTGNGRTIIRGGYGLFWNFTPGGTSSSKAQNQPFLQAQAHDDQPRHEHHPLERAGRAARRASRARRRQGSTRSAFLTDFRDAHAHNFNVNAAAAVRRQLHGRSGATRDRARKMRRCKTDLESGAADVGVGRSEHQPAVRDGVDPALRTVGALSSTGYVEYNGLLMKFQRRVGEPLLVPRTHTRYGRAIDLNSDNDGTVTLTDIFDPAYNRGPADYDVTHTVQLELDLRAAVGGAAAVWRLAGERHPLSSARVCRSTITQSQSMLSTGITNNRPNTICDPVLPAADDRSVGSTRRASSRSPTPPAPSATPAATPCAGRAAGTSTCR